MNKNIKRQLAKLAEMKCGICKEKLHVQGGEVVNLGFGEDFYVHTKCHNAAMIADVLLGKVQSTPF